MSKRIFLIIALFISLAFGKELVITKYFNQKPKISIYFNGPQDVLKILKMDLTVLDHFKYTVNEDSNAPFVFSFEYKNNDLTVKYIHNGSTEKIKIYKSNTYAYFPFLVHKAVYDINEYFGLPKATFLIRKVVYSMLVAPKQANIYIADYTLSYKKRIIAGGLNIFPKWADEKQTSIYFTRLGRKAVLYKFNLITGKKEEILSSEGMLIVSDIKEGKLLITKSKDGQPDVYEYDLNSDDFHRLTTYKGIDVNGKFWGDDKIVFVSDRYGSPMVFSKPLIGSGVKRVLYHGKNQIGVDAYKNYLVISSRETNNAFSKNTFNLFLVNKKDDSLKRLTYKGQNSFPNFSVDGNSIMFIKRENFYSKIGIIRLDENKVFYYPLPKILQSFDW